MHTIRRTHLLTISRLLYISYGNIRKASLTEAFYYCFLGYQLFSRTVPFILSFPEIIVNIFWSSFVRLSFVQCRLRTIGKHHYKIIRLVTRTCLGSGKPISHFAKKYCARAKNILHFAQKCDIISLKRYILRSFEAKKCPNASFRRILK